jgi:hypothetical protein
MLQVWFSFSPFVPGECGINMTAPLRICIKDKQYATEHFLVSTGTKGAEIQQQLALNY